MIRLVVAALLAVACAGCATTAAVTVLGKVTEAALEASGLKKPEVPADVPKAPRKVALRIHAGQALNTDAGGRSLSLVTRVYKLKDSNAFQQAPYEVFGNPAKEKELLGNDLVEVREVLLVPGQRYEVEEKVSREAGYVGLVALFRAPAAQRWKYAFQSEAAEKTGVTVGAHACALSVTVGAPVGSAENGLLGPVRCQTELAQP